MTERFLPTFTTRPAVFAMLRRALPAAFTIALLAGPGPAQAQGRAGVQGVPAERANRESLT